ncbi:MAG: hypothetical protein WC774_03660 [Candidatus Gracilibacteria bacterium]|jgi:hypothetical protein
MSEPKNELKMVIVESLSEEWRDLNRDFSHFKEIEKIIEDYKILSDLRKQLQKAKNSNSFKKIHSIEIDIFSHGPGLLVPFDIGVLNQYQESKFDSYYHSFIEDLLHGDIYEYKNFYKFYTVATNYYASLKIFIKTLIDFCNIINELDVFLQESPPRDQYHRNKIYHEIVTPALKNKNEAVRKDILTAYKNMKDAELKIKPFFEN